MALEQWEKDLRLQLTGAKSIHESWENDLAHDIADAPYKKSVKNNTNFFAACLIVLTFLILFVYDHKTGAIQQWLETVSNKSHDDIENLKNIVSQHQVELEGQQQSLEKLQARTKNNTEKINLSGILMNENFTIIRNEADRKQLIFFNRDWTIDKMPQHLSLSDEDKEYLQKYYQNK